MLNRITLTGADTDTDIKEMVGISKKYPLLEWGILFSYSNMGIERRYPDLRWITEFYKHKLNSSLHLCGKAVHYFLDDDPVVNALAEQFDRVQLNFNNQRTPINPDKITTKIHQWIWKGSNRTIITQHNEANIDLWKKVGCARHDILFDASGGAGKLLTVEPPLPGKYCSYAGGINYENVIDVIQQIEQVNSSDFGIDMESSLRTHGTFDLGICESILTKTYNYILPG
jgi:phosphoribosylanthranilate isomerase